MTARIRTYCSVQELRVDVCSEGLKGIALQRKYLEASPASNKIRGPDRACKVRLHRGRSEWINVA